jgi:hypothetical protein
MIRVKYSRGAAKIVNAAGARLGQGRGYEHPRLGGRLRAERPSDAIVGVAFPRPQDGRPEALTDGVFIPPDPTAHVRAL